MKLRTILILSTIYCLLSTSLCGCEAFRKKFVCKPKKEKEVEVIVHTQEYVSEYSTEETYKKYFLFWRTWHEELLNSLSAQNGNRKKRVFAAKKIVENLQQMRQLLLPEKQNRLDIYISEQKGIVRQLNKYNLNRIQRLRIKSILEKQRRQIQREFKCRQVQEYLIKE